MQRMITLTIAMCLAVSFISSLPAAHACTTMLIQADNGACVVGRSMEFAVPLRSRVLVVPRGVHFTAQAPGGEQGLAWRGQYGFVTANAFGQNVAVDGLNEAGLSMGLLWLPGTEYQKVPPGQRQRALRIQDLGAWLLSRFATVAEVRKALPGVLVWGAKQEGLGIVPPLHLAVFDASGAGLVLEFVGGRQVVYDNPVGVLTNAPTFDWHLTNLRNFVGLSPTNPAPARLGSFKLSPTGLGGGLRGLPGDWTPPSRLVRAAVVSALTSNVKDAQAGVEAMQHILNTVDIPIGVTREKRQGKTVPEYTLWATVKDLANRVFYWRDYRNMGLRKLSLGQLDLSAGRRMRSMPMAGQSMSRDVSSQLN